MPDSKNLILKKTSFIWPIVLFPYYERSHTLAYTGRQFIQDIRFSMGFATLYLTGSKLYCRFIFPRLLIFEIERENITFVSKVEDKTGVLAIWFNRARFGWLTRFALTGDSAIPRDRLFLNLGNACETWYKELSRHMVYKE